MDELLPSAKENKIIREAVRGHFDDETINQYMHSAGSGMGFGAGAGLIGGGPMGAAVGALGGAATGIASRGVQDVMYNFKSSRDKVSTLAEDVAELLNEVQGRFSKINPQLGQVVAVLGRQYAEYINKFDNHPKAIQNNIFSTSPTTTAPVAQPTPAPASVPSVPANYPANYPMTPHAHTHKFRKVEADNGNSRMIGDLTANGVVTPVQMQWQHQVTHPESWDFTKWNNPRGNSYLSGTNPYLSQNVPPMTNIYRSTPGANFSFNPNEMVSRATTEITELAAKEGLPVQQYLANHYPGGFNMQAYIQQRYPNFNTQVGGYLQNNSNAFWQQTNNAMQGNLAKDEFKSGLQNIATQEGRTLLQSGAKGMMNAGWQAFKTTGWKGLIGGAAGLAGGMAGGFLADQTMSGIDRLTTDDFTAIGATVGKVDDVIKEIQKLQGNNPQIMQATNVFKEQLFDIYRTVTQARDAKQKTPKANTKFKKVVEG